MKTKWRDYMKELSPKIKVNPLGDLVYGVNGKLFVLPAKSSVPHYVKRSVGGFLSVGNQSILFDEEMEHVVSVQKIDIPVEWMDKVLLIKSGMWNHTISSDLLAGQYAVIFPVGTPAVLEDNITKKLSVHTGAKFFAFHGNATVEEFVPEIPVPVREPDNSYQKREEEERYRNWWNTLPVEGHPDEPASKDPWEGELYYR